jgi:hypothetical protein
MRRISGFWNGQVDDDDDDKEPPFDPDFVSSPTAMSPTDTRVSLYDRLASATSAAQAAATSASTVVASATSKAVGTAASALREGNGANKLHIPPVSTPPPSFPEQLDASPSSDRTISPTRIPPAITAPPAPPPAVPHSSFGRVRKAEKPAPKKTTWDSSDDEDDKSNKAAAPVRKPPPIVQPVPKPARTVSIVTEPIVMESLDSSEEEDVPLRTVKTRASKQSLRPSNMARASKSSLKQPTVPPQTRKAVTQSAIEVRPASRPSSRASQRPNSVHTIVALPTQTPAPPAQPQTQTQVLAAEVALAHSVSNWSLSSDSQTVSPSSDDGLRPSSRQSARPPMVGKTMPRSKSSDKLRAPPNAMQARQEALSLSTGHAPRNTASPASSSRSGLTGDSSGPQPMTPKSTDPSRVSWADERAARGPGPEPAAARPAAQFGPWPGAPPMEMLMNPIMKEQYQTQWMAAARAYFDDAWERASTVSAAQTAPGPGGLGGGPTYGYSYQNMPPPPASAYGGYPQYSGYPAYNGYAGYPGMAMGMGGMQPAMGMMPGMPMGGMNGMGAMPMGAMPMGMPGNMYSYGAMPTQSVYGGEFGPPVAPFQQPSESGSSPRGSPRATARRLSNNMEGKPTRPSSIAHGHTGHGGQGMYSSGTGAASVTGVPASRRVVPPSSSRSTAGPGRRTSTLAMSEVNGPPSSWKSIAGEEAPSRRRVTNVS